MLIDDFSVVMSAFNSSDDIFYLIKMWIPIYLTLALYSSKEMFRENEYVC